MALAVAKVSKQHGAELTTVPSDPIALEWRAGRSATTTSEDGNDPRSARCLPASKMGGGDQRIR